MKPLWHDQATLLGGSARLPSSGGLQQAWRKAQASLIDGLEESILEWDDIPGIGEIIKPDDRPAQRSGKLYDSEGKVAWRKPNKASDG